MFIAFYNYKIIIKKNEIEKSYYIISTMNINTMTTSSQINDLGEFLSKHNATSLGKHQHIQE